MLLSCIFAGMDDEEDSACISCGYVGQHAVGCPEDPANADDPLDDDDDDTDDDWF